MARSERGSSELAGLLYHAATSGERSWLQALEALAEESGARCLCLAAEQRHGDGRWWWRVGRPRCGERPPGAPAGPGRAGQCCAGYPLPGLAGPEARVWLEDGRSGSLDPPVRLAAVLPDLAIALGIRTARAVPLPDPGLLAACLDRVPRALVALAPGQRIRVANSAARRLLEERDGLEVRRGELHAMRRGDDRALRALVGGASGRRPLAALSVPRPSGRRPYCVQACALGTAGEESATLLLIADPAARPAPPEATLAALFALTPTEARLAARLACGDTVHAAATTLGIGEKTARLHLEHVMSKTGVHRQGALVRLLLAAAAHWWPDPPGASPARRR